jgi:N-acetylneuraminic acid mutarotase
MKQLIQFKLPLLFLLPVLFLVSCKKDDLLSKKMLGLKANAETTQPFYFPGAHWSQMPDINIGIFPLFVYGSACFVINNKVYIATQGELFQYDPASGTWADKGSLPAAGTDNDRHFAVAFAIAGKGYIGTGHNLSSTVKDFWEYDPATNLWTQKADFKGGNRSGAAGFAIGNKGYLGTGQDDYGNYKNDFWEYDPAANQWTQKASMPSTRVYAVGLASYATGYVGTGKGKYYNPRGDYTTVYYDDFWEYNPATNQWKQKANLPASGRMGATGFALGGEFYLGTGHNSGLVLMKDFYKFNPTANSWKQIADYSGGETEYATGFTINNNGFVLRSPPDTGDPLLDQVKIFWKYVLTGLVPAYSSQIDTARY